MRNGSFAGAVRVIVAALAILATGAASASSDDEIAEEAPRKSERPAAFARPVGVKPYFLSPPPDRLTPSEEQRAIDYRSNLEGEIKRRERRPSARRGRREFDRMQTLRRERARIGRMIRR